MRDHTARYMAGGDYCFDAFESLAALLFGVTVLDSSSGIRLTRRPEDVARDRAVLGGWEGPQDPLLLRDGRFLHTSISLFLDREANRLKVRKASYQYQNDGDGREWLFRYDYIREGQGRYPGAHFQVQGSLDFPDALHERPLKSVHFPTQRVPMEGIIRLLAEQFAVPCAQHTRIWRPMLAEAEKTFQEIAHPASPGPSA